MRSARVVNIDKNKRQRMKAMIAEAHRFGLRLAEVNALKPWGGYLRFTQDSLVPFLAAYWLDVKIDPPLEQTSVDPKILIVDPNQMLSLQWHERRGEIWRVIEGPVEITTGDDWDSLAHRKYDKGDAIEIPEKKWHRLMGLDGWGCIAEFWDHTNPDHLSDEEDIIREHDIYGRANSTVDKEWRRVYPGEIQL